LPLQRPHSHIGTALTRAAQRSRILILDFGSQYTQLIARRIREQRVYCEIHPPTLTAREARALGAAGLVLSGGPASVLDAGAPQAADGPGPPRDGGPPRTVRFSEDAWVPRPPGDDGPPRTVGFSGGAQDAAPPPAPPPPAPDHYGTLGLGRAASTPEVRERYTRLAAEHAGNDAMIERITRAYGVLSDPEKRRKYDETLRRA